MVPDHISKACKMSRGAAAMVCIAWTEDKLPFLKKAPVEVEEKDQ